MKKCTEPEKCREIFRKLSEYVDDELTPAVKNKFERHIHNCKPCTEFILAFEKTIELCRKYPSKCPTKRIKKEIRDFLRRELKHS